MKSLKNLIPYLKSYYWHIFACVLLAIPLSAIRLGPAPLVRYMIDEVLVKKNKPQLIYLPFILIGIYLVNFVIRFAHYYLLRIVIIRVNQKIKNQIFLHILGLSADYFTHQSTGTLISRTSLDPHQIEDGLSCVNLAIREPFTLLFLFGYAIYLNWKLTLITLFLLPSMAWLFAKTGKLLKRYISKSQEINAELLSTLQESFSGIRVVKTFKLEQYVYQKFTEKNELVAKFRLKGAQVEEAAHPMVELLTALTLAPVLFYGGHQVLQGKMSAGDLFAFFTAFGMMMNPIRLLNDVNIKLNQTAAACDRIFDLLQWKTHLPEKQHPLPITTLKDQLEFRNVTFAYPDHPERMILKKVNFGVPHGKSIAIVGASGAGKSSLVSLIPRIFDVTEGQICIDGVDLKDFSIADLRSQIAVVSQDVFLFNDTIEENIRCGRLDATPDEILEAAKKAHALEFIERLPQGFQTCIGDRGQKLSGGERQRISIARAFLRHSPILILDEATSSLDSQSEKAVQQALDELMENRTTLVIAHRLTTIKRMHEILVLKDGQIVERGTHDELMNLRSVYFKFHETHSH
ncbi:ATP-binding cassette domain-containing protein [bacterium]|jgi:subfamily B ATP-binding cassette protein MsbA|nr:ATP-binding cassette domain-containing protein [bacterium]